ncbi:hypothetical protein LTR27_004056 [Elasticomyces elasticus]|nr:hypothetical protein LTR27_004056 [Elasticomyces elasticus]
MPPKPQPPADTKPPIDLTTGASQNSPVPIASATATPSTSRPATPSTTAPAPPPPRPSRGSSRGRVIATPKFTARRSATARAEAEKAENERKRVEAQSRAKEDAAKARREGRFGGRGRGGEGRGRGEVHRGRGRGGFMGERSGGDVASGPFSGGMAGKSGGMGGGRTVNNGFGVGVSSSSGGGGGGGGGSGGGSGGGGGGGSGGSYSSNLVKREPGGGDSNVTIIPRIKQEDGGAISSDEEDEEEMNKGLARINVEDLGVIDLTQDDDNNENNAQGAFQPVRLKREAHVDRTLGLNADATKDVAAEADDTTTTTTTADAKGGKGGKGKQRAKDVEVTGASEPFQSTYSSSDEQEPNIKLESTDEDGPQPIMAPPASPQPQEREAKASKVKTRALSGMAPAVDLPVHQTQDEVQEWERRQKDLELIFGELGTQTTPKDKDADGDANMTAADDGENVNAKREAKVYLFQFPPVLPDLTPIIVKPDPDAAPETEGSMDLDKAVVPPNTAANPISVAADAAAGSGAHSTLPKLPSGAVGKLRIHKSGKATLDWGGTKMSVGMGGEASFLQDVVILNLPEKKVKVENGEGGGGGGGSGIGGGDEEVAQPGWAMGMGQVKGKFVVTPDWDELLG